MCLMTIWNEYNAEVRRVRNNALRLEQARVLGGNPAQLRPIAGRCLEAVGFGGKFPPSIFFGAPSEHRYLEQSRALGYPASRWRIGT